MKCSRDFYVHTCEYVHLHVFYVDTYSIFRCISFKEVHKTFIKSKMGFEYRIFYPATTKLNSFESFIHSNQIKKTTNNRSDIYILTKNDDKGLKFRNVQVLADSQIICKKQIEYKDKITSGKVEQWQKFYADFDSEVDSNEQNGPKFLMVEKNVVKTFGKYGSEIFGIESTSENASRECKPVKIVVDYATIKVSKVEEIEKSGTVCDADFSNEQLLFKKVHNDNNSVNYKSLCLESDKMENVQYFLDHHMGTFLEGLSSEGGYFEGGYPAFLNQLEI